MITIDQVSKWYGSAQVLKRCSTGVAKGEVVVVCGPSGSGKSTLIKCVNGLEPFQEGAITVDGIAVGDRKTNLSKLLARVEAGEEIVIGRNGVPVAKLVKAEPPPRKRRMPPPEWRRQIWIGPDAFSEETDLEIERLFYGEDEEG